MPEEQGENDNPFNSAGSIELEFDDRLSNQSKDGRHSIAHLDEKEERSLDVIEQHLKKVDKQKRQSAREQGEKCEEQD